MGDLWYDAKTKCREHYAIAVDDNGDLFEFLLVCRAPAGDVYVNFVTRPEFMSHSSYHASGQLAHKHFNRRVFPLRRRQPPTGGFSGAETIITTALRTGDGRAINRPCVAADFDDVMLIPDTVLAPAEFGYGFGVELVAPGHSSFYSTYPYATIIQQHQFKQHAPWIVCTLHEMRGSL